LDNGQSNFKKDDLDTFQAQPAEFRSLTKIDIASDGSEITEG